MHVRWLLTAALLCGSLGCEAFVDFGGFEYDANAQGGAGGAETGGGAEGGGGGGGGGGAAGMGGSTANCLVDVSQSDDFFDIAHTENLWRTLDIDEPDMPMKTQNTSVGRLEIVPRETVQFHNQYLASLTYQDVCGDFGFILTARADDESNGLAPQEDNATHGIGIMVRDPDDAAGRWVILRSNWLVDDFAVYSEWTEANVSTIPAEPVTNLIGTADYALMVCRVAGQVHLLHKMVTGGQVTARALVDDYNLPDRVQLGFTVERSSNLPVRGLFSNAQLDSHSSLASCQAALELALE